MITSISDWTSHLRSMDELMAVPMIGAGLLMMVLGWRMWKFCVVLSFAAIGFLVTSSLPQLGGQPWVNGALAAIVLGGVSGLVAHHAISLLGGLIGAWVFSSILGGLGLRDWALWVAMGLSLLAFTALSFINRRQVVIVVTSFEGAVLMVSGLSVVVMSQPFLSAFFRGATDASGIIVPFVLAVPTVIGCFVQMGDARRKNSVC